jgi:hypothetical protein
LRPCIPRVQLLQLFLLLFLFLFLFFLLCLLVLLLLLLITTQHLLLRRPPVLLLLLCGRRSCRSCRPGARPGACELAAPTTPGAPPTIQHHVHGVELVGEVGPQHVICCALSHDIIHAQLVPLAQAVGPVLSLCNNKKVNIVKAYITNLILD